MSKHMQCLNCFIVLSISRNVMKSSSHSVQYIIRMIGFSFILIIFLFSACKKSEENKITQSCLTGQIVEFEKNACESGASVDEFYFQEDTVYVLNPGLCEADMASAVLSSGCETLGFLGGITGNTEINGEDFNNALYIRTIWNN